MKCREIGCLDGKAGGVGHSLGSFQKLLANFGDHALFPPLPMKKYCLALLSLLALAPLHGQITYSFSYLDADGVGFNDATLGATRRGELEAAMNQLASYFNPFQPVTLTYQVTSTTSGASLAGASSSLISIAPGFHPTVVQHKILTGVDANGSAHDGEIEFNFGYAWGFGSAIAADVYDFYATALHEGLHSYGFLSYINADGTGPTGAPSGSGDAWTVYDSFIAAENGERLINPGTFGYNVSLGLDPLTSGLFFAGANAVAAYEGNPIPLYAPEVWEDGSSATHLDDATFTETDPSALNSQKVMNSETLTGLGQRNLSAIEFGVLTDLGYDVKTIPEPTTWALIAIGGGMIGWAMRRRLAGE